MKTIAKPSENRPTEQAKTLIADLRIGTRFLGQDTTFQEKGLHEMLLEEVSANHVKLKKTSSRGSKSSIWYDKAMWTCVEVLDVPAMPESPNDLAEKPANPTEASKQA